MDQVWSFIHKDKSLVLNDLGVFWQIKKLILWFRIYYAAKHQREQLLDQCRTVPGGILEIVGKQEKGWSYIKAGY